MNIAGNFGVVHKGVLKTGGNVVSVAVKAIKSELFSYVLALDIYSIPYIHVCRTHPYDDMYGMKLCSQVYMSFALCEMTPFLNVNVL